MKEEESDHSHADLYSLVLDLWQKSDCVLLYRKKLHGSFLC